MLTKLTKTLFALVLICLAQTQASDQAPVVTDNDLVMSRQNVGETKRNLSVDGNPLSIAGKKYSEGIGTHAVSMIPISTIPAHNVLTGACGVDDEVQGEGSIQFQILSGSEVLWESPVMKKGMPAISFNIPLINNEKKLYLVTRKVDNDSNDHGDWVDLKWEVARLKLAPRKKMPLFRSQDFGIKANVEQDQGPAFRKMIREARWNPGCTINIPAGTYHFYPEGALHMSYHISNHDQPEIHPVGLPLVDLHNVKIQANGARFIFHGLMQPILVMDSSQITMEGFSINYANPFYSEVTIKEIKEGEAILNIDKKLFPYEIANNRIVCKKDYGSYQAVTMIAFKKGSHNITEGTSDLGAGQHATQNSDGTVTLKWDASKIGIEAGDTLTLRTWARPHPAMVVYRAQDTVLKKVFFLNSQGMGLLAQRSENIAILGGGAVQDKAKGKTPKRIYTVSADATHFSNTKGKIYVENALFENMMDDAINVHSTCLGIEELISPTEIRCKYMHWQAVGFEVFLPGESICFISGPTLENGQIGKVKSVRKLSTTELLITLEEALPAEVKKGDAVENADYYPSVTFKNNVVRNNRARGALFTTPKKVLVEGNNFSNVAGAAILLAGDAQGWYESGKCLDVQIRNNTFRNNLTSRFQFTNAIISIYPEIRNLNDQQKYYHENVTIENNIFDTFDVPIIFAISTNGITFINNKITYNNDFKGWHQKAFEFKRCKNILIKGNTSSKKAWTIDDVQLDRTDAGEVKFN